MAGKFETKPTREQGKAEKPAAGAEPRPDQVAASRGVRGGGPLAHPDPLA